MFVGCDVAQRALGKKKAFGAFALEGTRESDEKRQRKKRKEKKELWREKQFDLSSRRHALSAVSLHFFPLIGTPINERRALVLVDALGPRGRALAGHRRAHGRRGLPSVPGGAQAGGAGAGGFGIGGAS